MAYPVRRRKLVCAYCGKQFERMLSRYNGERAYCCIEHRNEGYRINIPPRWELELLREAFQSWSEIARELQVSPSKVSAWMRAAGLKPYRGASDRRVDAGGYVRIRTPDGWRTEHRVVAEEARGLPLSPGEEVHHKNGDRTDNRPENLEIWAKSHPKAQRLSDVPHCRTCTCWQIKTWSELAGNSQSQAEPKRPGPLVASV